MPRFSVISKRNVLECVELRGSKDTTCVYSQTEGRAAGWQASEVCTYDPHDRNEEIALRKRGGRKRGNGVKETRPHRSAVLTQWTWHPTAAAQACKAAFECPLTFYPRPVYRRRLARVYRPRQLPFSHYRIAGRAEENNGRKRGNFFPLSRSILLTRFRLRSTLQTNLTAFPKGGTALYRDISIFFRAVTRHYTALPV